MQHISLTTASAGDAGISGDGSRCLGHSASPHYTTMKQNYTTMKQKGSTETKKKWAILAKSQQIDCQQGQLTENKAGFLRRQHLTDKPKQSTERRLPTFSSVLSNGWRCVPLATSVGVAALLFQKSSALKDSAPTVGLDGGTKTSMKMSLNLEPKTITERLADIKNPWQ